ncbi:hypothetical protein GCM10017687_53080 [Streptomyces echinatus]
MGERTGALSNLYANQLTADPQEGQPALPRTGLIKVRVGFSTLTRPAVSPLFAGHEPARPWTKYH